MKLVYKSVERPAAKPAQQAKTWSRTTRFPFGKHRGERLLDVLAQDVKYITWCLENVGGFVLDADAQEAYEAFKAEA